MKNFSLKYLVLLLFSFVLITGCDDDDDDAPEVSPFVGNYVISEASLTQELVIPIVEVPVVGDQIVLPAGTAITAAIQDALLNQVNCDSADKSWIELREDESMYMSCEGSNELNAGTWDEVSATELKLSMNSSAVPPLGFALNVTNIVENNNTMSGTTSVPLPQAMVAAFLPGGIELAPDAPSVFTAHFSLDLLRK